MDELQVYVSIRSEILTNHVLIQWFTLIVAVVFIIGTTVVERLGRTILSVFLPLLSLAWAASVVRFDYFIHRQAAYLRRLEADMQTNAPLWETWKGSLHSTALVVPLLDVLAVSVIVIPTLYLLFVPAQDYFRSRSWRWGKLYALSIAALRTLLLLSIAVVPKIASY
jgi:hypothetical protein